MSMVGGMGNHFELASALGEVASIGSGGWGKGALTDIKGCKLKTVVVVRTSGKFSAGSGKEGGSGLQKASLRKNQNIFPHHP